MTRSRAGVTTLLKQGRDERERAHQKSGAQPRTLGPLSEIAGSRKSCRRAAQRCAEEMRVQRCASFCRGSLKDEGWEEEEGTCPGYLQRAKTSEQLVDKCGCNGLGIFFCEEVQKMKSFRYVEHPSRVAEDTGFLKRRSQTNALARDWAQKRHAEEAN